MPTAVVNPASIRFPQKCPHCGRKAEGTYAITAMRNLDVFLGEYSVPLLLDVPVCRDAFNRRRTVGLAWLLSALAIILAGGLFAAWLAIDRAWLPAALLGAAAVAFALAGRTGWDTVVLDRWILGASAQSVSSSRVRMTFSRDEYFKQWAKMNRPASAEG
jgi:hypothetical protein